MRTATKAYLRAFMAMIGMVLIFTGLIGRHFFVGNFPTGALFITLGIIVLIIPLYWWYKDYQKGGKE